LAHTVLLHRSWHCADYIAEAKLICARCQVRPQCLRFALTTRQQYGIWSGVTEDGLAPLEGTRHARYRQDGLKQDRA
jgi:hypothetical protein